MVAQSIGPALQRADIVVESFDKTQRHFVAKLAVRFHPSLLNGRHCATCWFLL